MSIGEVVRVWGAIGYAPDLGFFDKMCEVGKKYAQDYAHWSTDRMQLVLHDFEKRALLSIAHKRVAFEIANPTTEYMNAVAENAKRVQGVLSGLNKKDINRMGLKTVIYANMGLTFEELRAQMEPLCVPNKDEFTRITGSGEIKDIALHVDYDWRGKTVLLRAGPMEKRQGIDSIRQVGDVEKLYPPIEKSSGLTDLFAAVPSSFLYFDMDVVKASKETIDSWSGFVEDSSKYTIEVFDSLKRCLLEQGIK